MESSTVLVLKREGGPPLQVDPKGNTSRDKRHGTGHVDPTPTFRCPVPSLRSTDESWTHKGSRGTDGFSTSHIDAKFAA